MEGASGHSLRSIVEALAAGGKLLSEEEMSALLKQPNALEEMLIEGAHYFQGFKNGAVNVTNKVDRFQSPGQTRADDRLLANHVRMAAGVRGRLFESDRSLPL